MPPILSRRTAVAAAVLLITSFVFTMSAAGAGRTTECRGNSPKRGCPTLTPAEGSTVRGTVTLAVALEAGTTAAGAQFQVNGSSLGVEDTVAPYELAWDSTKTPNGTHSISAVVRNTNGDLTIVRNSVSVANPTPDSTAPTVGVASPAPSATVSGAVSVSVSASDNVGVAGVALKVDGNSVGSEDTSAPYDIAWDSTKTTNGTHTISAVARDAAGNTATHQVTVAVQNSIADSAAPTVQVTAPAGGSSVSGSVTLTASAADNVGVAAVRFAINGTPIGSDDAAAPYAASWSTTSLANGTYVVTATARDQVGNAATSAPVTVTVANAATSSSTVVSLSTLTPSSNTNGWGPYEVNRSNGEKNANDGRTLTLAGVTYATGFGVHAASELTFAASGCTRFRADVGVDDEVGNQGSVSFQVYADQTRLFDSGVLSGSSATRQIDVALSSPSQLRLVVTDGGNGTGYDHGDWANARMDCSGSNSTTPPPPPPPPPPPTTSTLPFQEAALRSGYRTLTVPATVNSITCPAGNDCLVDLQNVRRAGSLLIYGSAGSNIKVVKGFWDVNASRSSVSPYWRGGPRVRSTDGVGPDHVSLTDMLVTGSTLADGIAIDAGTNTRVTIQRTRIESPSLITGQSAPEATEHLDALQVQGKLKQLDIGLSTFYAASVAAPNHGGKALMLGGAPVGNTSGYTVNLNRFNMRGPGGDTGCFIVQDQRNIIVNMTDVWAQKEGAGRYVWSSGSGLFLAYQATSQWTSSGTAPNRTASFGSTLGFNGVIREGTPGGADYVTRSSLGL